MNEWPLTNAEYERRQKASRKPTLRPRGAPRPLTFTDLFDRTGPRPGETEAEWEQVRREAVAAARRRMRLNINLGRLGN